MKATEVKGITATKEERRPKMPVPYAPENMHLSKEQFIAKREAEKAAASELAEAEAGIRAKHGLKTAGHEPSKFTGKADPDKDDKKAGLEAKLESSRKKLLEAEEKLRAKPDSVHYNKVVRELNKEVEDIENKLE